MRLVTTNAKTFNPPGSIYYTEADRIETWAIEQITKAAGTVIEFETDWNIDVDGNGDEGELNVEEDDEDGDGDAPVTPVDHERSPSVDLSAFAWGRRPPQRAAVKKVMEKEREAQKEKDREREKDKERLVRGHLDEEGHMPGYKDGVGLFPPNSDWARIMLELKLKGAKSVAFWHEMYLSDTTDKRYKTKKERVRIEKEGLPHRSDGSLDYYESERSLRNGLPLNC